MSRAMTSKKNLGQAERIISSVAGGVFVAGAVARPSLGSILLGALGAGLLVRGVRGVCPVYAKLGVSSLEPNFVSFDGSVTVRREASDVYAFLRDPSNLTRVMTQIVRVLDEADGVSRWTARLPGGLTVDWRAQLVSDREDELIEWVSVEGGDIACSGKIELRDAPGDRGTEVHLLVRYEPSNVAMAAAAQLASVALTKALELELRRFKQLLETGEISTTDGQPSGRSKGVRRTAAKRTKAVKVAAPEVSIDEPAAVDDALEPDLRGRADGAPARIVGEEVRS